MISADNTIRSSPKATWRQLSTKDVSSLARIAEKIHPGLPESNEVFAERVKLFPAGCLALTSCETNNLCGYAISHPIRYRQPPALDKLLEELPEDVNQYYIHDLAILPEFQGRGYANACMERLFEIAKGYATTSLVSVYGTAPFWRRYGFKVVEMDRSLQIKLEDYGESAVFLERRNNDYAIG
jgi:ribosomal protein S18 acetylase RimI-like enzyme